MRCTSGCSLHIGTSHPPCLPLASVFRIFSRRGLGTTDCVEKPSHLFNAPHIPTTPSTPLTHMYPQTPTHTHIALYLSIPLPPHPTTHTRNRRMATSAYGNATSSCLSLRAHTDDARVRRSSWHGLLRSNPYQPVCARLSLAFEGERVPIRNAAVRSCLWDGEAPLALPQ